MELSRCSCCLLVWIHLQQVFRYFAWLCVCVNMQTVCVQASEDHMKNHYLDLKDMPFYAGLCKYMSAGPIFAMVTHTHIHITNPHIQHTHT